MSETLRTRREVLQGLTTAIAAASAAAPAADALGKGRGPHESRRPNIVFFLGEGVRADEFSFAGNPRAVASAYNKIGTTAVNDDDPRSLEEVVKDHYAGVVSNDEDVGHVLDALERKGRFDETATMRPSLCLKSRGPRPTGRPSCRSPGAPTGVDHNRRLDRGRAQGLRTPSDRPALL